MRSKKDMMCSCGKRKGACNCKGYAYGSKKIQGYYMGDTAVATPQQQQEMMAMQPGVRMQAPAPTPEGPDPMQQAVQGVAMNEAISPVVGYAKDQGSMALSSAKDVLTGKAAGSTAANAAGDAAFEAIAGDGVNASQAVLDQASTAADAASSSVGGAASSALSGFGGAAAADLLTKGKVDEKTLLKGGLAMGANMLFPGSGFLVGPAMSALGLKDGMMEVPPMGYASGVPRVIDMLDDDEEIAEYRRLSNGGLADINFSKKVIAQNKKAQEKQYKRLQEAMKTKQ